MPQSNAFSRIILQHPAILVGNGINRYKGEQISSWDELLNKLATSQGVKLSRHDLSEMSNTELFDILDLARPLDDRANLQTQFCELMASWSPSAHHQNIVRWASRFQRPIVTVNFDENLSRSIDAKLFRTDQPFTDYYPWGSYFSDRRIENVKSSFAIWHAHGMMRYQRSIRLGLTHYMGSVERARRWVYGSHGLTKRGKAWKGPWQGDGSWLDVFFHCPLVIFGFSFGKDETFLRWLFLERARIGKVHSQETPKTWFVDVQSDQTPRRKPFLEGLGINYVSVPDYSDIYECDAWNH